MSLTLVVLAAGIGRRYGGLKQIDKIGPQGEIIIDYSLYDAIRAGFNRLVIVIRRDIERQFREVVATRFEERIETIYAYQELEDIPAGFSAPAGRDKPWGTGHATMAASRAVSGPFAVINADDFYGRQSFAALAGFLRGLDAAENRYCMVGFKLRNTLTEHGHVARGVCDVDGGGMLKSVVERTHIEKMGYGARFLEGESLVTLTGDEIVSMNLWGFAPTILPQLKVRFREFLAEHGNDPKSEFFLPTVVDSLIKTGKATVKALTTTDKWFGVTYPGDRPLVVQEIRALIKKGVYPEDLWA